MLHANRNKNSVKVKKSPKSAHENKWLDFAVRAARRRLNRETNGELRRKISEAFSFFILIWINKTKRKTDLKCMNKVLRFVRGWKIIMRRRLQLSSIISFMGLRSFRYFHPSAHYIAKSPNLLCLLKRTIHLNHDAQINKLKSLA